MQIRIYNYSLLLCDARARTSASLKRIFHEKFMRASLSRICRRLSSTNSLLNRSRYPSERTFRVENQSRRRFTGARLEKSPGALALSRFWRDARIPATKGGTEWKSRDTNFVVPTPHFRHR